MAGKGMNLGDAFVTITPRWEKVSQTAIQQQLARVNAQVPITADTRPLVLNTEKAAASVRESLSKGFSVGVAEGTKTASRVADTAGREMAQGLNRALSTGISKEVGERIASSIRVGVDGSVTQLDRLQNSFQVAQRRMDTMLRAQETSWQRLEKAQVEAGQAARKYGDDSDEAMEANRRLEKAQLAAERAARRVDSAERQLTKANTALISETDRAARAQEELSASLSSLDHKKLTFAGINFEPLIKRMSSAGSEAGDAFARALEGKASSDLKEYNPGKSISSKVTTAGVAVTGAAEGGGTFKKLAGYGLGVAGAASIGSFAKGSFDLASGFEKQLSAIQAVSGATQDQMEQIKNKSMELGAATKYSTTEAAQAMEELVKAGLSVPDALGGAAKATTSLAAAGEVPLDVAATQISDVKNAFQLSAAQLPKVADLISGAANASSIDVKDFGYSMQASAAVAHQAGMSVEDTSKAIAELGNQGLKGSDAGTSLKTLINNFQPTSANGPALMEQYGLMHFNADNAKEFTQKNNIKFQKGVDTTSVAGFQKALTMYYEKHNHEDKHTAQNDARQAIRQNDISSNAFFNNKGQFAGLKNAQTQMSNAFKGLSDQERVSALQQIFGTDAERAAGILTNQGGKGYDAISKSMGGMTADKTAATRQKNFDSAKEQFGGSLENVRIKAAMALLGPATSLVNGATNALNKMGDASGGIGRALGQFERTFPNFNKQLETIAKGALAFGASVARAFGSTAMTEFKAFAALLGGVVVPVLAKVFGFLGKHNDVGGSAIGGFIALLVTYKGAMMGASLAVRAFQGTVGAVGKVVQLTGGMLSGAGKIASGVYRGGMLAARGAQLLFSGAVRAGGAVLNGVKWAAAGARAIAYRGALLVARGAQLAWTAAQKAGAAALTAVKWVWSMGMMVAHKAAQGLSTAATWAWRTAQLAASAALSGVRWVWSIGMMVAHRVASMAVAAAQRVMAAAQWLVNAAMEANPIGLVIGLLVALGAAFVLAYKHSATFRAIVQGAWSGIKAVASDVWDWMSGTLWPGLEKFFTKDIPGALHTFSSIFGSVWSGLQDLAKKPINFVIGTVINGMINGFDKISGAVGGPHIDTLPTLATGGEIPGVYMPHHRDNVLGVSGSGVPHVRVEPGEFVTNRKSTQKYAPLLHAINKDMLPSGMGGSQNTLKPKPLDLPGLAGGGVAGAVEFAQRQMDSGTKAWHDRCLAFVNQAWQSAGVNVPWLGVDWAIHSWDAAPDKHPGDANAPAGAAVYFMTHNPAKHIALGIGNGMVASTDWPGLDGGVGVAGIEQMASSWGPLIGWSSPDPSGKADSSTLSKLWGRAKGVVSEVVDYVGNLTKSFAGPLGKLSSVKDTAMGQMAAGFPKKLEQSFVDKIKALNPVSKIWGQDSSSTTTTTTTISGNLAQWISQGLALAGLPQTAPYMNAWTTQAMTESSGDPMAHQQIHDVNSGGNEAQGLLQVIPPTFRAFALPGHTNIFNPVDNAAAGMRYALSTYGSRMLDVIGHGHGYSTGTKSAAPGWAMIDERGDEWVNFNGGETVLPHGTHPKAPQQVLVGSVTITNWKEGVGTFQGQIQNEMDWRSGR